MRQHQHQCRLQTYEVTVPENLPGHAQPRLADLPSADYHLEKSRVSQAHVVTVGQGSRVAVLDSGATPDHPHGGLLEIGPSFIGGNGIDRNGHGTHVMGLVWQVAPMAEVVSVQVLNENNGGTWAGIVSGIRWCIEQGDIDIINLSLGATGDTPELRSVIDDAVAAGMVVCAASGNTGTDTKFYPAFYENVVAVGACDRTGDLWPFTSTGDIDTIAAGDTVLSNWLDGALARASGTSMACPIVSGIFALALSVDSYPTLKPSEVADAAKAVRADLTYIPFL